MNVLVIAPHPDDECIGCGGTICLHVERGDRVSTVFLTSGELGLKKFAKEEAWRIRENEAKRAGKILELAELHFLRRRDWFLSEEVEPAADDLAPILDRLKPELIYLPHEKEWHPDHKASLPILQDAMTRCRNVSPHILCYEVWTPLSEYQHVENVSGVMARKLKALRAHRSQIKDFNYPAAIRGLNQYRGVMAGRCQYAEVFANIEPEQGGK